MQEIVKLLTFPVLTSMILLKSNEMFTTCSRLFLKQWHFPEVHRSQSFTVDTWCTDFHKDKPRALICCCIDPRPGIMSHTCLDAQLRGYARAYHLAACSLWGNETNSNFTELARLANWRAYSSTMKWGECLQISEQPFSCHFLNHLCYASHWIFSLVSNHPNYDCFLVRESMCTFPALGF